MPTTAAAADDQIVNRADTAKFDGVRSHGREDVRGEVGAILDIVRHRPARGLGPHRLRPRGECGEQEEREEGEESHR